MDLTVEIYRPDPRPKLYLHGALGNASVNGVALSVPEAEDLVEKLNEALAELELG